MNPLLHSGYNAAYIAIKLIICIYCISYRNNSMARFNQYLPICIQEHETLILVFPFEIKTALSLSELTFIKR